jgi:hypothetical protein
VRIGAQWKQCAETLLRVRLVRRGTSFAFVVAIAVGGCFRRTNMKMRSFLDGIEHLNHLTERTVVHGGKAPGGHALSGLDEGSRVVVHDTAEGDHKIAHEVDLLAGDGLKTIEGVVTRVDRRAKTMSIRLADGSRQTLRLTERAASMSARTSTAPPSARRRWSSISTMKRVGGLPTTSNAFRERPSRSAAWHAIADRAM